MNTHTPINIADLQWTRTPGLVAQLMAVAHFVHRRAMEQLGENKGYRKLSLNFEGFMALLAERDRSPGELAERLGISRQACSKTVKELESLGFVERRKNPQDSRSSLLSPTVAGLQLVKDGMEITCRIEEQFADGVGADALGQLEAVLEKLTRQLAVELPHLRSLAAIGNEQQPSVHLILLVRQLSEYAYRSLIAALAAKGFSGLKPSFSQVLGLIGPDGGRIQSIASRVGVSKQAVAAIALELETLGYVVRQADTDDKRQLILRLSPLGQRLLEESEESVLALQQTFAACLHAGEYEYMEKTLATLYFHVIGHYGSTEPSPQRIQTLSRQLLEELGVSGARTLAQQLLVITRGDS